MKDFKNQNRFIFTKAAIKHKRVILCETRV